LDLNGMKEQWNYKDATNTPASLSVRDCDGNVAELERLPPHEARRCTLGLSLAPDGNNNDEIKHLQQGWLRNGKSTFALAISNATGHTAPSRDNHEIHRVSSFDPHP
jgi:hypothetical protein